MECTSIISTSHDLASSPGVSFWLRLFLASFLLEPLGSLLLSFDLYFSDEVGSSFLFVEDSFELKFLFLTLLDLLELKLFLLILDDFGFGPLEPIEFLLEFIDLFDSFILVDNNVAL